MLYINRKQVSIEDIINAKKGESSEPLLMLQEAYTRIINHGWPCRFKFREGIIKYNDKAKLKEGKKAVYFPREETIQTKKGSFVVNWSDNATPGPDGMPRFNDRNEAFRKVMVCNENDIERALWMLAFNSQVKSGLIILEDLRAEASKLAGERAANASLSYYIYAPESPLASDIEKLRKIAYAWGVVGAGDMEKAQLQNALLDRVQFMEREKNTNFNIKAFVSAVNDEFGKFLEATAIIIRCEEKGIIEYDARTFEYSIKSGTNERSVLLQISPTEVATKRETLARYLASTPKKLDVLKLAIGGRKEETDDENMKAPAKPNLDEEAFVKTLGPDTQWDSLTSEQLKAAKKAAGLPAMTPNNILIDKLKEFYSSK